MTENTLSEQLEEGEIVDDDFEDISDNSIIEPSTFGKLVSPYENLRALSLSSDDNCEIKPTKCKRKLLHRKLKLKHPRRRKKPRLSSDSSDSDISPSRDLKGKLKEAIHISGLEANHKNTLETRLKAMGGLTTNTEPPMETPEPKNISDEKDSSDKIDDVELENLRMEALKTAVLNKCQRRKRKKTLVEVCEETPVEKQENKENDTPKEEQNLQKNDKVEANNAFDLEEDEDVLRASLLATLSKNISKKQTMVTVIERKAVPAKLPVQVVPALPKRPINNFKKNINKKIVNKQMVRPKPLVKPLIININNDSDTEEEVKQKVPETTKQLPKAISKVQDLKAITTNVENFLKEQRAIFETENQKKDKSILEKSAVKLLPKSQQIEYQQLLKRLRTAERRKRVKKLALQKLQTVPDPLKKQVEVCTNGPSIKLTVENAPQIIVKEMESVAPCEDALKSDSSYGDRKSSRSSDVQERSLKITTELTTLQRTLKEIKMQRNGSLQIKSKYQVLTPIIRKITTTSNERKKQEQRIKALLKELNEAKNNLAKSHQKFSTLVRELVDKKEQIDESCQDTIVAGKKKQNGNITKENKTEHNAKDTKSLPVTSTPIKPQSQDITDEPTISTLVTSFTNNECEDMDVCNSDETDVCQIDIVDPNDIDQIFKRKHQIPKSTIPEYISPLNFNNCERYNQVDPLGIMCPYEVNGSCRDNDCSFKHYLKNHKRL